MTPCSHLRWRACGGGIECRDCGRLLVLASEMSAAQNKPPEKLGNGRTPQPMPAVEPPAQGPQPPDNHVPGRAETGAMQFGDDWPGVFIRGDNALAFALHLERPGPMREAMISGLVSTLKSCAVDERNCAAALRPYAKCVVGPVDSIKQALSERERAELDQLRAEVAKLRDDAASWEKTAHGALRHLASWQHWAAALLHMRADQPYSGELDDSEARRVLAMVVMGAEVKRG